MSCKKLYVFDFDGTLFHTPGPEDGKRIWEEKTGMSYPYNGWWGKSETLNIDIFHIPINEWVYRKYLEAVADEDSHVILATGRLEKVANMRSYIEKILNENNLSFDGVYLNTGGDTYRFKTKLFEDLSFSLKVNELIMYDDRHEHIVEFKEWGKSQPIDIKIVDIVNKKETLIKNKK